MVRTRHDADERLIVERLTAAGWQLTEGGLALGSVDLEYDNSAVALHLSKDLSGPELLFTVIDGAQALTIYPVYGEQLEPTLDAVVHMQDRITSSNVAECIGELVIACPEVCYQEDEDTDPRLLVIEQRR